MYEIHVIERHARDGLLTSTIIPCGDDDVNAVVEDLVKNEEVCIGSILLSYTILTWYTPNNEVPIFWEPAGFFELEIAS